MIDSTICYKLGWLFLDRSTIVRFLSFQPRHSQPIVWLNASLGISLLFYSTCSSSSSSSPLPLWHARCHWHQLLVQLFSCTLILHARHLSANHWIFHWHSHQSANRLHQAHQSRCCSTALLMVLIPTSLFNCTTVPLIAQALSLLASLVMMQLAAAPRLPWPLRAKLKLLIRTSIAPHQRMPSSAVHQLSSHKPSTQSRTSSTSSMTSRRVLSTRASSITMMAPIVIAPSSSRSYITKCWGSLESNDRIAQIAKQRLGYSAESMRFSLIDWSIVYFLCVCYLICPS